MKVPFSAAIISAIVPSLTSGSGSGSGLTSPATSLYSSTTNCKYLVPVKPVKYALTSISLPFKAVKASTSTGYTKLPTTFVAPSIFKLK